MAETADLVVHIADPAGLTAKIFRTNDEADLSNLLDEALLRFMRDPGWFEVNTPDGHFYACQLVTHPFMAVLSKHARSSHLKQLAERVGKTIYPYYSDVAVPDAWIMVNRDLVTPLRRPTVNLWLARRLNNSLKKSVIIEPGADTPTDADAVTAITELPAPVSVNVSSAPPQKKRKGGPDADKVTERVTLGWRVRVISEEQTCP